MPVRLPRAEDAIVEARRVRDYLLNADHPSGGSKSRFFHAYGFTTVAWNVLRASLIQHGRTNRVVRRVETEWGLRYTVECDCPAPDGRNPCIRTVWQMEQGVPRLITVLPTRLA